MAPLADEEKSMVLEAAGSTGSTQPRAALELCPGPRWMIRERMPGQVAHDLLGIVTIIRGYAEIVPLEANKELQEEYCVRILRACSKMADIVDSSLELSRQEADMLQLTKRKVDLAAFLSECLAAQAIKAKNKGMALSLEFGAGLPMVDIDPDSLERILSNLLDNAIKFSHPTSSIKLTARVLTDALEIEVKDNGQGIPAEEFTTLFEPYKPGSVRPTGGEPTTGLGLSIVKELVEAHHGVIDVRSEVGHGSTFSVCLPLDTPLLPAAEKEASPPTGAECFQVPVASEG